MPLLAILVLRYKRKKRKGLIGSNMAAKWGKKNKEVVGGVSPPATSESERISNKLDRTLVAESKISKKQQLKARAKKITTHRRFKPAVIALVAIVVLSSLAVYFGREDEQPVADTGPKCTYQMLEAAKPNIKSTKINTEKLEPQVAEIEQIPGYDTDPNCLYVTTTYYISISDAQKARENYDKLAVVYDKSEGFETVISDVTLSPEELKGSVEFLENQKSEVEQNALGVPVDGE